MERIKAWLKAWFKKASEEALAYLSAIAVLIAAVLAKNFGFSDSSATLVWVSLILMVYGFLSFLSPKIMSVWNSLIGKAFFTILTFIGTTLCLSIAEQIVNYSLEVPSSPFVYTQSIVALLVSPMVILVGIGVIMMALIVVALPVFLFGELKLSLRGLLTFAFNTEGGQVQEVGLLRIIAFLVLIGVCFTVLEKSNRYVEIVADITRWYAFHLETERHSYCKLPEGVRVAYITSDMIVTATHDDQQGYTFVMSECEKSLE
jgi:hypothetical protein